MIRRSGVVSVKAARSRRARAGPRDRRGGNLGQPPRSKADFPLASATVSRTARTLRIVSATAAGIGIASLVWWFALGSATQSDSATTADPTATAVVNGDAPTPGLTVTPPPATAVPTPTPTPVPTPLPFGEAVTLGAVADQLTSPLPDCGLLRNDEVIAGTVALTCIEDWSTVPVVAVADGRIVNVVRSPAFDIAGVELDSGQWSWSEQARLGPHVVIDHGPLAGTLNTQTVYAGLNSIDDGVRVGAIIAADEPIGMVSGPSASLRFSVWVDNERQDGVQVLEAGPGIDVQRAAAEALRDVIASPTDERCPLVLSSGSLPGAPRQYRNGTHRGIDFGCGAADRSTFSIADGTVVYVVDDYRDPSVAEREALLQLAGIAGFTPHWTLVMLYGNVVVIDHGEIPGAGHVVTISAHLEATDPAMTVGARVARGQRVGEIGNRGTNASALGIRGSADPSLHLHWELYIDNWYLGADLDSASTVEVMATALCGAAQTAGCPA